MSNSTAPESATTPREKVRKFFYVSYVVSGPKMGSLFGDAPMETDADDFPIQNAHNYVSEAFSNQGQVSILSWREISQKQYDDMANFREAVANRSKLLQGTPAAKSNSGLVTP